MRVLLQQPNRASEELPDNATIEFTLKNGSKINASLTGGGDLRIDAGGRKPIMIVPIDHSAVLVKIEPV
jgi:hypothetical protein